MFSLFLKVKPEPRGRYFYSNTDVIGGVEAFMNQQDDFFLRNGIIRLEHRWNKCNEFKGGYAGKK